MSLKNEHFYNIRGIKKHLIKSIFYLLSIKQALFVIEYYVPGMVLLITS